MLNKIPKSHFYAFGAVCLWASAYVVTRLVVLDGSIGAAQLGFIRNLTSALFLSAVLGVKGFGLPPVKDWPIFLLGGLTGFALYMYLFSKALETVDGGTSAILLATSPLITALLATFIFKERLSRLAWFAMFLALSGVAVLSLWENGFNMAQGVYLTLASAVSLSCYNIVQRYLGIRGCRKYSPLQISGYCFVCAALLSLFLFPGSARQFMAAPITIKFYAVSLGILPSSIGFMFWAKALSIAKSTNSVVNYMFLTPFLALVACFLFLDEAPNAGTFVGGAIILAGFYLFRVAVRPRTPKLRGKFKP